MITTLGKEEGDNEGGNIENDKYGDKRYLKENSQNGDHKKYADTHRNGEDKKHILNIRNLTRKDSEVGL